MPIYITHITLKWVKVPNFQNPELKKFNLKICSMLYTYILTISSLGGQLSIDRLKINKARNSPCRLLVWC